MKCQSLFSGENKKNINLSSSSSGRKGSWGVIQFNKNMQVPNDD